MNSKELKAVTVQIQVADKFGQKTKQLDWTVLEKVSLEQVLEHITKTLEEAEF